MSSALRAPKSRQSGCPESAAVKFVLRSRLPPLPSSTASTAPMAGYSGSSAATRAENWRSWTSAVSSASVNKYRSSASTYR